MKTNFLILKLFLYIAIGINGQTSSQTFTHTGAEQSFVVPAGVNQITFKVWGAGGAGRNGSYMTYTGGSGGYAEAVISVTPGETLKIIVGGGGGYGATNGGNGGWPGGGYGTKGDASGGGGGGLTGVFKGSFTHANSLIIAGAGGGGGYRAGGAGGGSSGGNGSYGGYGGSSSAGGTGTYGADGSALQGGNGDSRGSQSGSYDDGGGGGAGYYGGEGGYQDAGGGGGGSGYVSPTYRVGSYTLTTGTNGSSSDVNPPNTISLNYISGVGVGRKGAYTGGNGLVYAEWSASAPMLFSSATTIQASTDDVCLGTDDNKIVSAHIVTSGSQNAISATQFKFLATGTSTISDVYNIKLFCTTSPSFNTSSQFGATIAAISDTIVFTSSRVLATGDNYFWLTYCVDTSAEIGNLLDAECVGVIINDTLRSPSVSSPTGARNIIDPIYSITATTSSVANLFAGDENSQIISCVIDNRAASGRVNTTSLTFNTNGSTSALDISNAKVYYTASASFSASNQFGSTIYSPSGSFSVNGNQTLSNGNNYFWLVFDIAGTATPSNIVDAECNGIVINGIARVPSVQAPAGSRTISSPNLPTIQATNISFSSVSNFSMVVSWTNGNGAKRAVFAKLGSPGSPSPLPSTSYNANYAFGSGDQIGSSGWYCVYNGTGSIFTLTGLSSYSNYQIQVCEYNGGSGNEVYLTSASTNNPRSQLTNPFSGGIGSAADPYQVQTTNDLLYISQNSSIWSNCFLQIADIEFDVDSSLVDWNLNGSPDGAANSGFSPVGNSSTKFSGYYNGNNKIIKNLYINKSGLTYVGLFGYIYSNSMVANIKLVDAKIIGYESTGGIVGYNYYGIINNCEVSGKINGSYRYTGGIVGYTNYGKIQSSINNAQVVQGSGGSAGGIVGYSSYGTVELCKNYGAISSFNNYIGGIVGQAYNGVVRNSSSSANVGASSSSYVGGIVGYNNYGNVLTTFSAGNITGASNVGGLVGYHYQYSGTNGFIKNSYSKCNVSGTSNVGGLAGYQYYSYIENSYSTGSISGSSSIGALVGYASSAYTQNSFFNSDVYATSASGTAKNTAQLRSFSTFIAAGWNFTDVWNLDTSMMINNGYPYHRFHDYSGNGPVIQSSNISSSSITATGFTISWISGNGDGRVVFVKAANSGYASPVDNTTYTANTVFASGSQISSSGWFCVYQGTGTTVTITGLAPSTEYLVHVCEYYGLAGSEAYQNSGEDNNPLKVVTLPQSSAPVFGDGTAGNPYQIASLANLFWIYENTSRWNKYYIQTADIDASNTSLWYNGAGWLPIGTSSNYFTGTYNGQNHSIVNLVINRNGTSYIGLFGYLSTNSVVKKVNLTNVSILGASYVGGIAGRGYSSKIQNCTVSGSITSLGTFCGGIIGENNYGLIEACQTAGDITGLSKTGGIAGSNSNSTIRYSKSMANINGSTNTYIGGVVGYGDYSNISNSFSTGNVTGGNYTGGLSGYHCNSSSTTGYIKNCYSSGTVSGGSYVGGLVGYLGYAYIQNSFSVSPVSGGSSVGGLTGTGSSYTQNSFYNSQVYATSSSGTAKNTTEMKTLTTYTSVGWNFLEYWLLDENGIINDGYPYLSWVDFGGSEPMIPATTIVCSSITGNSMTITWVNGNGDARAVFIKEDSSGKPSPLNNNTYLASTTFGSGDQVDSSGWYCVYNGYSNTVSVTSLNQLKDYMIFVSEYFGSAGSEIYTNANSDGNPLKNTMPPLSIAPTFGTGSINDPYQISCIGNLYWITENTSRWTYHYLQTENIDASITSEWFSGEGWKPIGTSYSYRFTGSYNGGGKSISNLYINRSSTANIGLFGYIASPAVISNVNLVNASIIGGDYTGALIGYMGNSSKSYTNSSSGNVTGNLKTGGLIGYSDYSRVVNCNSSCNVVSTGNYSGGLIGQANYGNIHLCYATGNVSGVSTVGGLVGENYHNGKKAYLSNCYSNGTVVGTGSYIGGLMGMQQYGSSYIINSYSTSSIGSGGSLKGGLTGSNSNSTAYSTVNSYFNSDIYPTSSTGTAKNTSQLKQEITYSSSSWDFEGETVNGTADYWKIDAGLNSGYPVFSWQGENSAYPKIQAADIMVTNPTTTQITLNWGNGDGSSRVVFMKDTNSGTCSPVDNYTYASNSVFGNGTQLGNGWYCVYNGKSHTVTVTGLSINKTYMIQVFEYNGTPGSEKYLKSTWYNNPKKDFTNPVEAIAPAGNGTSGNDYLISSLENLFWVSQNYSSINNSKYFKQTANIDASSTATWYDGQGWMPLGQMDVTSYFYASTYDGQNFTITGLTINRPDEDYVGLFGYVVSSTIRNLGFLDANIIGRNYTGTLAGHYGSIGGGYYVYLRNCFSTGSVKSNYSFVGGLVGYGGLSSIENCYSTCNVSLIDTTSTTSTNMGGLVGQCSYQIRNSYATGNVRGYNYVGGLAGSLESAYNSYSRGNVYGNNYVGGFMGISNYSGSYAYCCYSTGSVFCSNTYFGAFTYYSNASSTSCLFNVDTDGIHGNISGSLNNGATGKTTSELLLQSTYTNMNFNFTTNWAINPIYNDGLPYLQTTTPHNTEVYTWTGAVNNNWNNAGNWDKNVVPQNFNHVFIPDVTNDLDVSTSPASMNFIVGQGASISLNSDISVNGVLALNNNLNFNGRNITLGSSAVLAETAGILTGDSGCISTTRILNNINENIAGLGVKITTAENMGLTTIERSHKPIGNGVKRVFKITPTNNSGLNATLVFQYNESELNGKDESKLTLFKSSDNGQTWSEVGGVVDAASNTVTISGLSGFSWWTLDEKGTILPVELISFSGKKINDEKVILNWETASELNNDFYSLLRSFDGLTFYEIAKIDGAGNSNSLLFYSYLDCDLSGVENGVYYQLQQFDFDGNSEKSKIIYVDFSSKTADEVVIFPNPTNGLVTIMGSGDYDSYEIYNNQGQLVKDGKLGESAILDLSRFPKGIYNLVLMSCGAKSSKRIMVF